MHTSLKYRELIRESYFRLPKNDKRKLTALTFGGILTSVLDLIAVGFIGLTAALAASGVSSSNPNSVTQSVVKNLNIQNYSIQNQVMVLALIALALFVLRTILSVRISKKLLTLLFTFGAIHADELFNRLLNANYAHTKKLELNNVRFALTRGSQALYVGFLGGATALIGDVSIVVVLGAALAFIDLQTALASLLFFGIIGLVLHSQTHSKIIKYARKETEIDIKTSQQITDLIINYKFLIARGGLQELRQNLMKQRMLLADYVSELTFLPSFSKYFIESALIVGAVALSGFQFLTKDAASAITSLGIFLAAGSRISPAILRVQQSFMSINRSISTCQTAIDLRNQLIPKADLHFPGSVIECEFMPRIEFKNVSYKFHDSNEYVLSNVSFKVFEGEHIVITGQSGAGKTTLLNLLLGIFEPTAGEILLSSVSPQTALEEWPGKVAYVPQETHLINGTIRENLLYGVETMSIEDSRLWEGLKKANLHDFVHNLPNKLDQIVGEFGSSMSGGQKQRLALARALITEPSVLILDEATSSIDSETEIGISNELIKLKKSLTIISIAHKQESINVADKLFVLESGILTEEK